MGILVALNWILDCLDNNSMSIQNISNNQYKFDQLFGYQGKIDCMIQCYSLSTYLLSYQSMVEYLIFLQNLRMLVPSLF